MAEAYRLSRHARDEMVRRAISLSWLESVLQQPEQRVEDGIAKEVWQSRFTAEHGKMYLVRAVMAVDKEPPVVVTVYRTSKIEKYWRTE
jgi:hypothetical protein